MATMLGCLQSIEDAACRTTQEGSVPVHSLTIFNNRLVALEQGIQVSPSLEQHITPHCKFCIKRKIFIADCRNCNMAWLRCNTALLHCRNPKKRLHRLQEGGCCVDFVYFHHVQIVWQLILPLDYLHRQRRLLVLSARNAEGASVISYTDCLESAMTRVRCFNSSSSGDSNNTGRSHGRHSAGSRGHVASKESGKTMAAVPNRIRL